MDRWQLKAGLCGSSFEAGRDLGSSESDSLGEIAGELGVAFQQALKSCPEAS
jgi:hypothetical protein